MIAHSSVNVGNTVELEAVLGPHRTSQKLYLRGLYKTIKGESACLLIHFFFFFIKIEPCLRSLISGTLKVGSPSSLILT